MKQHMLRYARQLRTEKAQAYIIGYSPRVVEWEIYNRSYGEIRAGQARSRLSEFFDYKRITTIDGGFREGAMTESGLSHQAHNRLIQLLPSDAKM